MGLADYISSNPFAKTKKVSTYDHHFLLATISKIRGSFKHLIRHKTRTVQKFKRTLKLHSPSYSSSQSTAPQIPTLIQNDAQFCIKPVALQSLCCKRLLPLVPQLTSKNKTLNLHLGIPIASQMPSKILKPQIITNNSPLHKLHSINKFVANMLQKSNKMNMNNLNN